MAERALRESDADRAVAYRRELDDMGHEFSVTLSLLRVDLKDRDVDRSELLARTLGAEGLIDERHFPHQRAELLTLQGRIRVELGEVALARAVFERAVEVTPVPSNPGVIPLLRLVLEQRDVDAYRVLRKRIYAGAEVPAEVQRLDRRVPK